MTERQILLVKNSWKLFRKVDPKFIGEVFYGKLFQQLPSLRSMFKGDMTAQYGKLVDMLSLVITRLDKPELVTDEITQLAIRHVQYGVRPGHYKLVGDALLWTMEHGLGSDWDSETAEAWSVCYAMLSDMMIKASFK